VLGWFVFRRLTQPLRRLATRMHAFNLGPRAGPAPDSAAATDEVRAMEHAFTTLAQRIETQARERMREQEAHRETIANVAHDLRTPLTALHGHLEALSRPGAPAEDRQRHLSTALAQSERVRRLSQQLFELASLQAQDQVVQAEPVQLGELVTDAVQKFAWPGSGGRVVLTGAAPEHAVLEGDPLLLERALTNLIDNALRHTEGPAPVRVWMESDQARVRVVVEDTGPGLPSDVAGRLAANRPLREPPLRRPADGFGGLGLAIAQRIAWLHGGIIEAATPEHGGTRLALALPVLRL
jgi:signal transduction histidine kinase